MVMSLHFANSSALFGVLIFIGAWKLECRHQSLRLSYNLAMSTGSFHNMIFINVCFNGTVLLPCESGEGQGSLLPSISSSRLGEKTVNPEYIKTNLPRHKFIAFSCLWLLGLSGEAEPLMVISHWQAFLLWVFVEPVNTCKSACPVAVSSPVCAWLQNSLPFLSYEICMCCFFSSAPYFLHSKQQWVINHRLFISILPGSV